MGAAFRDGRIDAQQRADAKGIVGRFFNADVSAARRDGQNIEPAAPLRQRPANRVVMPRVAVSNNRNFFQFRHSTSILKRARPSGRAQPVLASQSFASADAK